MLYEDPVTWRVQSTDRHQISLALGPNSISSIANSHCMSSVYLTCRPKPVKLRPCM